MAPKDPGSNPRPPQKGGNGKIANSLVALGSAAVLTVYAAGYVRTRAAAERYSVDAADLRDSVQLDGDTPGAPTTGQPSADAANQIRPSASTPVERAPETLAAAVPDRTEELKRTNTASSPTPAAASPAASSPATKLPPVPSSTASSISSSTSSSTSSSSDAPSPSSPAAPTPPASPTPAAAANETPATPSTTAADSSASSTSPASSTPSPAPAPAPPPPPPGAPQITIGKDGRYLGWGYSRHGDIEAAIVILDGRIVSTEITQCLTRYSCDVIAQSPGQVIERQSPFIDLVSGSTESANAYANAVYRAIKASLK